MPAIIKPRTLGIMTQTERQGSGASLIVSAYGMFHLATPDPCRFEDEQGLWLMVGKELPPGAIFDGGMPKPVAEVLVGGYAAAAGGRPVPRMGLSWEVAGRRKSLLVTGDRTWRLANTSAAATEPVPFVQMPLTPARCFGGEGFAPNPAGTGFRARERVMAHEAVALPNLEIPEQAVRSFTDTPDPAAFGPMAFDAKERLRHAGTYDGAWLRTRAPGLAADVDPRLFLFAPGEQRLTGFLQGGEDYRLRGFSADHPTIEGRLPDFRVRCFVGWTAAGKPVVEVRMRIDTLWLFAGAGRGILIHRGTLAVEDFEAADVADVMLAYERPDAALPEAHYLRVRELRTDREQAFKYALADHQLSPARPQEQLDARAAARRDRDGARRAKQEADLAWIEQKYLAGSSIPPELRPPPPKLPPDDETALPLPLPEEIASGEIDLAALLDAMEATQRRLETTVHTAQAEMEPKTRAIEEFKTSDTEAGAVDRLFAGLGKEHVAADLDSRSPNLPDLGEIKPVTDEQAKAFAAADGAKDWRKALWDAAHPQVDEAAQLALARARFLGLPEANMLSSLSNALDRATFAIPDIDLSTVEGHPAVSPAADEGLARALAMLDSSPGLKPDTSRSVRDSLADADAKLRAGLPNLKAKPGEALETLSAAQARMEARDPSKSPAETLGESRTRMAELEGQLRERMAKESETAEETLAAMRRISPSPTRPEEPFTDHVARALGALILAEARAGLSLVGRDLAGADLRGADLSGHDLSEALMENVRLDGATLTGARLAGATLCGASLVGADLSGCDLTGTNLAKADATRARFADARLVETTLLDGRFSDAAFEGAELREIMATGIPFDGASFRRARASSCLFTRCDFAGARWTGASLTRVHFIDGDCTGIAFVDARLAEVSFLKIRAGGADFSDATYDTVTFAGEVDLQGALFPRITGQRFSIQGTDLSDACFERARLDAACFTQAVMTRANFKATSLKRAILARNDLGAADFSYANLWEAQPNRADLRGASFACANLYGADLSDARLTGADLADANLGRTVLRLASHG
ncbi:DUF2169 family type VI secretion system accessory protein [Methylobacterium aerolatum]|uniref:Uncharacterized protein YjbI with pentapeptide repeats n=1 Tax=Methylobacterium aerolatum TaxID=418708 RepID=A0ABU0HX78_9HYPH|nr:DUF2169 domain-containing protein [Methylobacterium aerolatum]MDQ0446944.1 uncharacterized protein YjbI with pentapeptide repeats [Methylobacterium aerolatum]GJD35180.1 hypothetical protein FMGBMHLM_2088 [Methylobacterium aerolatum]